MRGADRWLVGHDEAGAAMVEFVVLAVALAVPLCFFVLAVFDVQRAAYGATAATREAARVFVRAPSTAVGEQRARAAAAVTLADHGIALDGAALTISCTTSPCLTPGGVVEVGYRTDVPLPWLPGGLGVASVPVAATHRQTVDVYTEVRP